MSTKPVLLLLLVPACAMHLMAAPAYKLLYSASGVVPGAYPGAIFEVRPGTFYVLSTAQGNLNGASIFSISSDGTFDLVYSSPPFTQSYSLVQATNGRLYGAA